NIKRFYSTLETLLEKVEIKRFYPEKSSEDSSPIIDKEIKIYLKGRIDLLIETSKDNYIIDYKTGSIKEEQLDFYSVMLYGNSESSIKGVFNVMKDNIEWAKKVKLTAEELKSILNEFLMSNYYKLAEKNGDCLYCTYENVCRKELKNV
ncbi:MAG: PD-(D/E)XK nuclease family protein, partial [Fusobacteriaceae bacterium]